MNKKYFYYVLTVNTAGRLFSFAHIVHISNNLVYEFKKFPGLITIQQCGTFKEAKRIADMWNDTEKENQKYRQFMGEKTNEQF